MRFLHSNTEQSLKSRHWRLSTIKSKYKLMKICLQIFRTYSMIRPIQPSFEISKCLVNMARNIWICMMAVIFQRCFRISSPAIRTYGRTFFHMCNKKILYRSFISLFSHVQTKSTRLFTRCSTFIDKGNYFNSTENQSFSGTRNYSSPRIPLTGPPIIVSSASILPCKGVRASLIID